MIIISLGSNVTSRWGESPTTILRAYDELERAGVTVIRRSALYRTYPYGITDQPLFTNAAAVVQSALSPTALLKLLKIIEAKAGRKPSRRWGPRPLDIDIIDYKAQVLNWEGGNRGRLKIRQPRLILPHPETQSRLFVLRPMQDIAPYWHHPISHKSLPQLMAKLRFTTEGGILETLD